MDSNSNLIKAAGIIRAKAAIATAASLIEKIPEFLPKEAAPTSDEALFWEEYRQIEASLKRLNYFLSRMK